MNGGSWIRSSGLVNIIRSIQEAFRVRLSISFSINFPWISVVLASLNITYDENLLFWERFSGSFLKILKKKWNTQVFLSGFRKSWGEKVFWRDQSIAFVEVMLVWPWARDVLALRTPLQVLPSWSEVMT